jgi:hypothetical protein
VPSPGWLAHFAPFGSPDPKVGPAAGLDLAIQTERAWADRPNAIALNLYLAHFAPFGSRDPKVGPAAGLDLAIQTERAWADRPNAIALEPYLICASRAFVYNTGGRPVRWKIRIGPVVHGGAQASGRRRPQLPRADAGRDRPASGAVRQTARPEHDLAVTCTVHPTSQPDGLFLTPERKPLPARPFGYPRRAVSTARRGTVDSSQYLTFL